ncbi:hypothetical protein R1flu_026714 [Riccia fluitans]|uniref:Uncharacterized protein n=1 Tax=Riccia fluitans TaxID=41844 RepID=A0ABD1XJR4_9MARC
MPPDLKASDYCLATHEAWQYAARQIRSEEMVVFVNTKDSEADYPSLTSELRFRYKVPPFVHPQAPTTVSQAFGNFMYSKLVRTLRSPLLIVRQRSVAWAIELLSVGENRARCVQAGFVPILAEMLREKDMHIRQNLALCFQYLAEAGQAVVELLCMLGVVKGLINMVASDNRTLRGNAFRALQDLSAISYLVRYELVKEGNVLAFILKRIIEEKWQNIQVSAFEVLSQCISGANYNENALKELLAVDAVPTAIRLIQSPWRSLQESACRFLSLLCMHNNGKTQAVEKKAVDILVPLLSDIEPRVQAFACAALCCIIVDIQGKKDFVIVEGIPLILKLLDITDEQLCLYDLALLLNVAEYPPARAELFTDGLVALREIIKTSTSPLLKKRAQQGLQQLHFKHLPHQFPYDKMDKLYLKGPLPPRVTLAEAYSKPLVDPSSANSTPTSQPATASKSSPSRPSASASPAPDSKASSRPTSPAFSTKSPRYRHTIP